MSANNKRIAKNTIFLYIRMIFVLAINLYTSRVVLRTLGVVDYGVYNVVAGFVTMFSFLNTSMSNGIQRFFNYELGLNSRDGISKVYTTSLTIQILLAVIIVIIIESFGVWYLNNVMEIPKERMVAARFLFQFSIISLLIVLLQIPYAAAIMAFEKMNYYAIVGVVDVLLKLLIVVLLPILGIDYLIAYGALLMLVSVIIFLLYYIYSKRRINDLKFQFAIHKDLFKSMLGFSGWNVLGTFSFMLKEQGLNLLLNYFFGPIINAARGVSAQVMNALQSFSSNIVIAFRPQLVQSYAAKEYERVRSLFFVESKISYVFILALMIPISVEIEYILDIWLGHDIIPDYTVSFTFLALINTLVSSFHTPMVQIVHATGKMKVFQITVSLIVCSIIPISWGFLRLGYNPNSVYIVSLIVTILNLIASIIVVHRLFPFSYLQYFREVIIPCGIVTILSPVLPILISKTLTVSFVRLITICFIDVVTILVLTYLLVLTKAEKNVFNSYIIRVLKKRGYYDKKNI